MQKVIEAVQQFVPQCEQERVDKELFLHVARTLPDSLTRDNMLAHFTASVFVINETHDKVLCIYHNIYNSWGWMGGHADGDDDLFAVAKKEAEEESGVKNVKPFKDGIFTLDSLCVLSHTKNGKFVPAHTHLNVVYVFVASEKEAIRIQEDENSDVAWLTFDELLEKTTEVHMIPVYKKIIERIKKESNK